MKRNSGLIAGFAVVLALFGVSNLQKNGSESPVATESKESPLPPAKKVPGTKAKAYAPCTEIAKRLQRFVRNAHPEPIDEKHRDPALIEDWDLPNSCYELEPSSRPRTTPVRTLDEVHFAIAIVPNPVTTHLQLQFDRIVETLQQAAQDDNYSYDASWFPWDAASKEYPLLADQLDTDDLRDIQQAQPGVMVFRRALVNDHDCPPYNGGLVIFLVSEQPTRGISDEQFENALQWMHKLGGFSEDLRILGPTYSGSLPSLQRVLERGLAPGPGTPGTSGMLNAYMGKSRIHVSSGTVSSGLSYRWFRDWIEDIEKVGSFQTAIENDDLIVDRFCRYLSSQGYRLDHVALLSEGETAFGGNNGPICYDAVTGGSISLTYPRDIATLRSAYERQSIFRSTNPQSNANVPSTTLRGDLSEPSSSDHDTVRSYGGQLTPLAQESVLLDITSRLKDNQIQFIVLRSTSSLDQIFLSEFLRRSYPGGRVVIDGADLLISRGSEGSSLRGVMMLSTYPLLTQEQDWTSSLLANGNHSYRTFGEDLSEGVYIAARELFRNPDSKTKIAIHDYTPPAWAVDPQDDHADNQHPATWVSVSGHRQFWPVAVLNSNTLKGREGGWRHLNFWPFNRSESASPKESPSEILQSSAERGDRSPLNDGDREPLRLPITMWMFLIACIFWSSLHLYLCRKGSIIGSARARAYFAPVPGWEHPALIALGSLLLAMVAVVVATSSGFFSALIALGSFLLAKLAVVVGASSVFFSAWVCMNPFHSPVTPFLLGAYLLCVLCAAYFSAKGNYRLLALYAGPLEANQNNQASQTRWQSHAGKAVVLFLGAFALLHAVLIGLLTSANRIPAYWRSVNLLSGVSPLLPQVLLIAGAYFWFWCSLRGLAHFGEDRPLLPKKGHLPNLPKLDDQPNLDKDTPAMPMFSYEEAQKSIEAEARPLTKSYLGILGALLPITIIVCAVALHGFWVRTLGELAFGWLIFFWVSIYISVTLADGIQLWRVWSELRQLLVYLDRLPLRRTLSALKGIAWGSIWKMSGNVLEERYRVVSLQLESLNHLRNTINAWVPDNSDESEQKAELVKKVDSSRVKNLKFVKWYLTLPKDQPVRDLAKLRDFQEELASIAGLVMKKVLFPAWQTDKHSLIFTRSSLEGKGDEDGGSEVVIPTGKLAPHVRAAEEFFLLPYLAFIQNSLGRIRTIALGTLWLFVSATFAISSYPFDPLNVLGGIFLTVFVVVGGLMVVVYSQMCRDATLSHITNTRPGELGWDFWVRLLGFGIGPVIGLLTTLFPSISDFVFSWLQPSVQALK